MSRSVFSTPVVTPVLRCFARLFLKLVGWKIIPATLPEPPFVFVAAPHTSNWDFVFMVASALVMRLDLKWMGKHTLFRFPFKSTMLWMGGIPINRSKAHQVVSKTVKAIHENPQTILCIPPEGTRKKVTEWKTGFYHIAHQAKVPILLAAIDGKKKTLGILGRYDPTGNVDQEITEIQLYFKGIEGIRPENTSDLPQQEPA